MVVFLFQPILLSHKTRRYT